MTKRRDYNELVGLKFGRWEVMEYSHYDTSLVKAFVICKCDCGTVRTIKANSILTGKSKSCGCLMREVAAENGRKQTYKRGVAGQSGLTIRFHSYKKEARKLGREFSLSREVFKQITSSNCFYCGIEPLQVSKHDSAHNKEAIEYSIYLYNGIDRVDNTKGYIIENVVPCCGVCNKAKRSMSYSDFVSWVKRLTSNLENIKKETKWL